jgi:serine/threonine protein kinase
MPITTAVAPKRQGGRHSFLMIGRHLRQYLVTASLGRGGMGEVWLARDTTLERDVAIKTLPTGDADGDTRKARFFREARAASALNHPNIITIYEINSDQGVDFIAMEYVDGRTLADLLEHGPLPFDQVQRFAQQIAEAVGRAHRAGIVHRDLKPRNIMVTNDGLVKVLDFGLAKITRAGDAENAATQAALTRSGTTVGTLGYMSPEQAIGDAVDARSDVFSFGVILFEMLTGRLPFSGKTMSEVLRQLHFAEPPPVESLRADVPAPLRGAVTRALQKKPDDRFANMTEVAAALREEPSTTTRTKPFVAPVPPVPPKAGWRPLHLALAGLLIVLMAGIGIVAMRASRPSVAVATPAAATTAAPSDPPPISLPPDGAPPRPAASQAAAPKPAPATASQAASSTSNQAGQQIAPKIGDPDVESQRALDLARRGERKAAVATIDGFTARQDLSAQALFQMAIVYELAGARQRALMLLSRAVRAGYPPQEVFAEPELAALRKDPRFQRMAKSAPARKRPPPH